MKSKRQYGELVALAEGSVASMKDPDLKRAAFEKILEDLLTAGVHTSRMRERSAQEEVAAKKAKRVSGPSAYVRELIKDGFFKKPKTISQVKIELANGGHHIPITSLSGPLQALCQQKTLRRLKTKAASGKLSYNYSEC